MIINKIQSGIPIPHRLKYPWDKLEVGDSVLITAEKGEDLDKLNRTVNSSARQYRYKTGTLLKPMLDREENGVRVWRLE